MTSQSSGPPVSVIATVYNEGRRLDDLIASLLAQSLAPREIVIVDGGSTDGTFERLEELARHHDVLRVHREACGRSRGRNLAIELATNDHIACIDGGCVAEPDWLSHLVEPFSRGATFVAGFYRPVGSTTLSTSVGLVMVYVREEVDPDSFLPSGRSMAFTRDRWRRAGGFPESLQFAEDTLFDERMIETGGRPIVALDAVVLWAPPSGFVPLARTLYRWGRGDGEAGLRGSVYKRLALLVGGTGALVVILLLVAPPAAPLGLLPLVADAVRRTRHKYRWGDGVGRFAFIPLAQVVHTVALLIGFLVGRRRR